ncbi:MAG: UPF0149 family protein [Alphaproteobacteria bacterium]
MSKGLSKKLRQLDDFLLSDSAGDDAMLLSELDGFLAGVIVCPDLIMPGEWMPVIWGDDEGPEFDGVEELKTVSNLILGHYNDIIRQLDRGRYHPIFDIDFDGTILWETWIEGFMEAMRLRPDAWIACVGIEDADLQQALFVLSRLTELATNPNDIEPLEIDEELEDLAPDLIAAHVKILHRVRLAQTKPHVASVDGKQPNPGRNAPCPCGSGKKFKKCCLN